MLSRAPLVPPVLLVLALGLAACRDYEPIAIETIEPSASASASASGSGKPSSSPSASPSEPSASPEAPREVRISDLSVGDCTLESSTPEGESISNVMRVDCSAPHDREVVAIGSSTLSTYDETALTTEVDAYCSSALIGYTGGAASGFTATYMYPSEAAWTAGNHSFYCFAMTQDGSQSTGSLKEGPSSGGAGSDQTRKSSETT